MKIGPTKGVCCNVFRKGVYGRIGYSKEVFNKVGGYDESFLPAGKHDTDLKLRCELIGYIFVDIPCKMEAILNSKDETTKNIVSDLDWKTMNIVNTKKMHENISNNNFCPNKKFTKCELIHNFSKNINI
jgi:predicted glycosyltransferase involved in capsule biosynthesis